MKIIPLILLIASGCSKVGAVESLAPEKIIKASWANKQWTDYTLQALSEFGGGLLTSYPEGACGDRRQFYVMLLSEMARYESAFNPKAKFTEGFDDSTGKPQISAGLLQLSLDDAKYYGCEFKTMNDLFNPRLNLRCGVKIMNRWVIEDGVIAKGYSNKNARGGARYWSVLRRSKTKNAILSAARRTCK